MYQMCCIANIPTQRATVILFWSQTISKHCVSPDFVVLNIVLCHNRGGRSSHLELLESTHKKPIGNLGKKAHTSNIGRCLQRTWKHVCFYGTNEQNHVFTAESKQRWQNPVGWLTLKFTEWIEDYIWVPVSFLHMKYIFGHGGKCLLYNVIGVDYTIFPRCIISFLY